MLEAKIPQQIDTNNLPQTNEQLMLAMLARQNYLLECILACLDRDGEYAEPALGPDGKPLDLGSVVTKIEPTPTPFLKQQVNKKGTR